MAQYKVPQDVEADDKLIGPFGFRQFIYLLVAAGFLALCWLFISLGGFLVVFAIIPFFPAAFLIILALPLRKDQPMETYIAALIAFYRKPRKRYFNPGQRESTIEIIAPKIVEQSRTRNITSDDASQRLSFLANIVDSEGYSIKNGVSPVRDEFVAEANATPDMFDIYQTQRLQTMVDNGAAERHAEAIKQMRAAIKSAESLTFDTPKESDVMPAPTDSIAPNTTNTPSGSPSTDTSPFESSVVVTPGPEPEQKPEPAKEPQKTMVDLAHNKDLSVSTIAQEAKRMSRKADENEVYISLH